MLSEETHSLGVADTRLASHEDAAHEKRNWVRLTFDCNNGCTFCLDSNTHDGTNRSNEEIKRQILDGRAKGATRLILSGGEPTIHPHFVDFVKLGRLAGYRKIQTVTNGRLFSYPGFLDRSLSAGLNEITFSLHGPNPKIHDALVGVPGAFEQETAALKAALADGRPVVNVDIVINRGNIKVLPEMLELFISWGVREFDLLQVVPFGRAFNEGRESLFYDLVQMRPYLLKALEISKRPELHLWFNRFPAQHLEGYEHLIQDPYKLNDEVRGRKEEFQGLTENGIDLDCREPERCGYCYVQPLCDTLYRVRDQVAAERFERVRVDTAWEAQQAPVYGGDPASKARALDRKAMLFARLKAEGKAVGGPDEALVEVAKPSELARRAGAKRLWLKAPTIEAARAALAGWPADVEVELEVDEPTTVLGLGETLEGRRIAKVLVSTAEQARALLGAPGGFEVSLALTTSSAEWVSTLVAAPVRLTLRQPTYERLTDSQVNDVVLRDFFARLRAPIPVDGVPVCVTAHARSEPVTLDTAMMTPDGRLEAFRFTKRYILDHYFTKSLRCVECVHVDACRGLHVNHVRAHGYVAMQPVKRAPALLEATAERRAE
jgi:MoaA/NifB/PqqE/SkfB family radical SAM enzyme